MSDKANQEPEFNAATQFAMRIYGTLMFFGGLGVGWYVWA